MAQVISRKTNTMEQYYSNDSLTAFKTETGIHIEERKKGSLKMILLITGLGLAAMIAAFGLGMIGGNIGRIMAPFLFWGGGLILVIGLLGFIIKGAIQGDPKLTIDTTKNELTVRGKIYPFSQVDEIVTQKQDMMGRTMIVAFMMIAGKKKSLFSTAIVVPKPIEMEEFISNLNTIVQDSKNKKSTEE